VVRSIDHTEGKITCMAFRVDSQYLITGGEDCSCKLWELSSGKLTQVRKCVWRFGNYLIKSYR
jgi:WD40 repeat protein